MPDVPGSIHGRACLPSWLEFSAIFSETRVNTDLDPLELLKAYIVELRKILMEGTYPVCPGTTCGQLGLTLQHNAINLS